VLNIATAAQQRFRRKLALTSPTYLIPETPTTDGPSTCRPHAQEMPDLTETSQAGISNL